MSVADYFNSMDYGPAPEDDGAARAWLEQHDDAALAISSAAPFAHPGG